MKIFLFLGVVFCLFFAQKGVSQSRTIGSVLDTLSRDSAIVTLVNESYRVMEGRDCLMNVKNKFDFAGVMDCRKGRRITFMEEGTIDEKVFKKVFSKERMAELRGQSFTIVCIIDSTGCVHEIIRFLLASAPGLTFEEVEQVEKEMQGFKVKLLGVGTPRVPPYDLFGYRCDFKRLYENYEVNQARELKDPVELWEEINRINEQKNLEKSRRDRRGSVGL